MNHPETKKIYSRFLISYKQIYKVFDKTEPKSHTLSSINDTARDFGSVLKVFLSLLIV